MHPKRHKRSLKIITAAILSCIFYPTAFSQTFNWTNGGSAWDDPITWGLPEGTTVDLSNADIVLASIPETQTENGDWWYTSYNKIMGPNASEFTIKSLTLDRSLSQTVTRQNTRPNPDTGEYETVNVSNIQFGNSKSYNGSDPWQDRSNLLKITDNFIIECNVWTGMDGDPIQLNWTWGLDIGKNLVIGREDGSGNVNVQFGNFSNQTKSFSRVYTGEQLQILNNATLSTQIGRTGYKNADTGQRDEFSMTNPELRFGGGINMGSNSKWNWGLINSTYGERFTEAGGLYSAGGANITIEGSNGQKAYLILKKDSGLINADFKGVLTNNNNDSRTNTMDVYMQNDGIQKIRLENGSKWAGTIYAEQGTVMLNNGLSTTNINVNIKGGKFGAVAAQKPNEGEADIGITTINNLTWDSSVSGGGIIISGVGMNYSAIDLTGTTAFAGDEFIFYFDDFSAADIDPSGINLNMIVGWTDSSNREIWQEQIDNDTLVAVIEGQRCLALWEATDFGLNVSITAIPEPATIAAILGALALSFAAYRRRRH